MPIAEHAEHDEERIQCDDRVKMFFKVDDDGDDIDQRE
jgi:hypothetical protein